MGQVVPRQRSKIQVRRSQLRNEQLGARERAKRRDHFYITPTGVAGSSAIPRFFAIDVEITEQMMVVCTAENATQPGKLPRR